MFTPGDTRWIKQHTKKQMKEYYKMKSSKREYNYDSPLGKMIMKLKKLATAIEVKKGPGMDIDDVQYRWVDDRIELMEKRKNGTQGGRMLTRAEMSQANELWTMYGTR
jgi:hypothetical protein